MGAYAALPGHTEKNTNQKNGPTYISMECPQLFQKNWRMGLTGSIYDFFLCYFCHHLADINQASASFGVFPSAITPNGFLFSRYSRENHGAPIFSVIRFDLFFGVLEAVAHQLIVLEVIFFWAK
jgi:hypothetical protein